MTLPDLCLQSAGFGCWLSRQSVWELAHFMSVNYHKRLSHFFVGDECDLEQAAAVALLEYEATNGPVERMREGVAVALIHKAFWDEIAANRRQSAEYDWESLPDREQRTNKQIEMLELWVNICSKTAHKPCWLMSLLYYGCEWSLQDISDYYRSKKDDRHSYKPDAVEKHIKLAKRRLKKREQFLTPYHEELLCLSSQPEVGDK